MAFGSLLTKGNVDGCLKVGHASVCAGGLLLHFGFIISYLALLPSNVLLFLFVLPSSFRLDSNEFLFELGLVLAAFVNSLLVWIIAYLTFWWKTVAKRGKEAGSP